MTQGDCQIGTLFLAYLSYFTLNNIKECYKKVGFLEQIYLNFHF